MQIPLRKEPCLELKAQDKKGVLLGFREGPQHFLHSCSLTIHYILWAHSLSFHKADSRVDEGLMGCLKGTEQLGLTQ